MKKLLQVLWLIFIVTLFIWGLHTYWPDVYMFGLESNGDSPQLVLSWDKVYKSENVWAYAYINNSATITTNDNAWHAISWAFTNEVSNFYSASGTDLIVYNWHTRRLLFLYNRCGTTDTTSTTMSIGIKRNWVVMTGTITDAKLANVSDHVNVFSMWQALMSSGDTIQLVVRSNKNAVVTADTITASSISFY